MDTGSYLGGLITGEGHFGLTVRWNRHNPKNPERRALQVNPTFRLSMADETTVSFAAEKLTELGLPVYRAKKDAKRYGSKKQQFVIGVDGHKRVRRYCETLLPYLTGDKKRSAEIVLEFIRSRDNRARGQGIKAPYTEDEMNLVNELRRHHGRSDLIKNHF